MKFTTKLAAIALAAIALTPMTNIPEAVISNAKDSMAVIVESKALPINAQSEVIRSDELSVYYVGDQLTLKTNLDEKTVDPGNYVVLTENGSVPDEKSSISSGVDQLVKVPDELKSNFTLQIKGVDQNNAPVKVYMGPNEALESSSTFQRPSYFTTDDLTVYNGKFLKVHDDDGVTMYVNTNDVQFAVTTEKNYKVVGEGNERILISKDKHFTTDLNSRTNFTEDDLRIITSGTNLEGLESAVVATEEKYGVNAIFILGVAATESGWGNSDLAQYRNNLFGICAYDTNTDAATSFASKAACIDYFGRLIKNEYFTEGRLDLWSINDIYASDKSWAPKIHSLMLSMISKIQ